MKISYNWLRDYIETSLDVNEIAEILTSAGLEVESVEKVEAIPGGLKGVVVGEVLECEKHPDADRLRITKVNLGDGGEAVQIVCGAPNVAAGQKVLVATIGAKLFPTEGEPIVIKKGKIRGQESAGMICAEDELGLGKSHDGILVLENTAVVGTPAARQLNLNEDYCIEIGLTPNRTDAISHFGVARDLFAAIRNMEGGKQDSPQLKRPSVKNISKNGAGQLQIEVQNTQACPRYSGLVIEGVKVEPSPKWLQERLAVIGLRPINNLVDITNYVQHEIGQPLHAFDLDKISGGKVIVRMAQEAESFHTLDGIERKLSSDDLMICDASKPMCIAGVFGGQESGVTDSTTRVFLESAYFNPVNVRKTAKRHGLHTDASFRFERGCDPSVTVWTLERCAAMILEIAGGTLSNGISDIYPEEITPKRVVYNWSRTQKLIGKNIPTEKVKNILNDLEMKIVAENAEEVEVLVPLYRNDVTREADIVEDVLRIYGYNQIDIPQSLKSSLSFAPKPDFEKIQNKASDFLASVGYSEMMSMSLTKVKYREYLPEATGADAVELLNPLSGDLGQMRQSLLFGGLEAIKLNRNHRQPNLKMFEFGKIYSKQNSQYKEEKRLAIFLSGSRLPESWNNAAGDVSFADLKGVLENLLASLQVGGFSLQSASDNLFNDCLECTVGKLSIAKLGNVAENVLKEFDINAPVWYAEIIWENVIKLSSQAKTTYKESSKFPTVRRDLSLLLPKSVTYSEIEKLAREADRKLLREVNLFDVYEGKNLEEGKKSYAVSFMLQDQTKTLTDQQIESIMSRIQKLLEEKLGAALRSA